MHTDCDSALQTVYRAVVVARLLYAASAWWGFTTAAYRQRIEGFLRRGVRAGYRHADEPTAAQLVEDSDDQLSTGSSMSAATFCSHCFLTVALTHMHCQIGDMTYFLLPCRLNPLTVCFYFFTFLFGALDMLLSHFTAP